MNLSGQAVKHAAFGKGIITDFSGNKISICFSEGQKLFLYPEAFSQFLTLENESLQQEIQKINEEHFEIREAQRKKTEQENIYRSRIYTMKIPLKSQIAFDISAEEADKAMHLNYAGTGCILSGKLKGKPRIPSNVQPNTALLFTECGDAGENERCIFGVAMVDTYFWGSECQDGQITLHDRHKLILPAEKRLPFWNYFRREAFPAQWGKIPFKYFQNQTMQKVLYDICSVTAGTSQEKNAIDLYSYFSSINRLPEIQLAQRELEDAE